jgi:GNAT superfamily N-acetyltransferase
MSTVDAGDVIVRDAQRSDVGHLVELIRFGALDPAVEPEGDLAPYLAAFDEIASSPSSILVAELDGKPVGVLQLIIFRHLQHQGGLCAEIESMHVHPDYRSRGVGGILLEAAVARANDAGCYRVQLTSNLERTDAHRFYVDHDFADSHKGFKRLF